MDNKNTSTNYNPKSHSPAVYIPCWLIQVPSKLLSTSAKMLYGRLSQWCNETGEAFRSAPQLAQELGISIRQIERHIKELKDIGLIKTFQKQAGGQNHFSFSYHPWMQEPVNKNLSYKNIPPDKEVLCDKNEHTPPSNLTVPPVKSDGTPPSNVADINIKEIKTNTTTISSSINFDHYKRRKSGELENIIESEKKELLKKKFREESLNDGKCLSVYISRFKDCCVGIEEIYDDCVDYWSQSNQFVYKSRFLIHLKKCPIDRYFKESIFSWKIEPSVIMSKDAMNERLRLQEELSVQKAKEQAKKWFDSKEIKLGEGIHESINP